jgi:hypothetical protein
VSVLADAVPTLAAINTLAEFDAWWKPRVDAINRAAVTDPDEFGRIARAIEAMHERRRRRERAQMEKADR